MKNFIFTFNYVINYGAFLQCFALFSLNEDNVVADLMPCNILDYKYSVGSYGRKKFPFVWRLLALKRYCSTFYFSRKLAFKENNKIALTKRFLFWDGKKTKRILDKNNAIVGSDQVWNPKFIGGRERVFFANIADYTKRIAYAVSLGVKKWPEHFEQQVLPYIEKFDAISVREKSALEYLQSIGIKNVAWTCDPTMLHEASFYRKEFGIRKQVLSQVFVYTIRENVPQTYLGDDYCEAFFVNAGKKKNIISVSEWLTHIDASKYIITDSFHCVVFCLLFHKNFIVLQNNSRGKGMNERFISLLGRTKLMYRCIESEEPIESFKERLFRYVDWDCVDSIIDEWRQYSLNWLKNALDT